jgi:hypothetical protein
MPIGPRRIENIIRNLNPKVFFSNTLTSEADSFVHIGTNTVLNEQITPQYGFLIKNISYGSAPYFYVKYSDIGYEQVFEYFCEGYGCMSCGGDVPWFDLVTAPDLEVIGNIYENPELLK